MVDNFFFSFWVLTRVNWTPTNEYGSTSYIMERYSLGRPHSVGLSHAFIRSGVGSVLNYKKNIKAFVIFLSWLEMVNRKSENIGIWRYGIEFLKKSLEALQLRLYREKSNSSSQFLPFTHLERYHIKQKVEKVSPHGQNATGLKRMIPMSLFFCAWTMWDFDIDEILNL